MGFNLDSTSFGTVSLTQMVELEPQPINLALPEMSEKSQKYTQDTNNNRPIVPAAPTLFRLKSSDMNSQQSNDKSVSRSYFTNEGNIQISDTSWAASKKNLYEQKKQYSFEDSEKLFEETRRCTDSSLSHNLHLYSNPLAKEQMPLQKFASRAEVQDLEYGNVIKEIIS